MKDREVLINNEVRKLSELQPGELLLLSMALLDDLGTADTKVRQATVALELLGEVRPDLTEEFIFVKATQKLNDADLAINRHIPPRR